MPDNGDEVIGTVGGMTLELAPPVPLPGNVDDVSVELAVGNGGIVADGVPVGVPEPDEGTFDVPLDTGGVVEEALKEVVTDIPVPIGPVPVVGPLVGIVPLEMGNGAEDPVIEVGDPDGPGVVNVDDPLSLGTTVAELLDGVTSVGASDTVEEPVWDPVPGAVVPAAKVVLLGIGKGIDVSQEADVGTGKLEPVPVEGVYGVFADDKGYDPVVTAEIVLEIPPVPPVLDPEETVVELLTGNGTDEAPEGVVADTLLPVEEDELVGTTDDPLVARVGTFEPEVGTMPEDVPLGKGNGVGLRLASVVDELEVSEELGTEVVPRPSVLEIPVVFPGAEVAAVDDSVPVGVVAAVPLSD